MSARKRRAFTTNFKLDTVMEGFRGEKNISRICRERNITDSLYYKWRDTFIEQVEDIFKDQRGANTKDDEDHIAELERTIGRLTQEQREMITAISKDYPIKSVCQVLGLPRSTYYNNLASKADDEGGLAAIGKIIMERPYYGYRRIIHQLKRRGYKIGETRVRRFLKQLKHS